MMYYTKEQILQAAREELLAFNELTGKHTLSEGDYKYIGFVGAALNRLSAGTQYVPKQITRYFMDGLKEATSKAGEVLPDSAREWMQEQYSKSQEK